MIETIGLGYKGSKTVDGSFEQNTMNMFKPT